MKLSRWARKIPLLLGRDQFRSELEEEMAFHREQVERELIAEGKSAADAHFAAARQFGNQAVLRERSHRVIAFGWETIMQDLRFATRQLRQNPGFALTAIFILALGTAVAIAIFAFVDAALLEPLPYPNPGRLMAVDESAPPLFSHANLSRYDYDDWRRLNRTFSSIEVYGGTGYLLKTSAGIVPVAARRVSDGFFSTLGVRMQLGRGFLPGEDQPGKPKIVVLSYGTWLDRFGGNRNVVGQTITLSGNPYVIVGVLPREFEFAPGRDSEFWVPLLDRNGCEQRRSCHNLDGLGRLRDGVTMQQALADLKGIAVRLEQQYPNSNKGQGASVMPLAQLITGDVRPILLTLLAGAGLLLLITCVNVANLVLVKSESRRREIAVREALGATPSRLVRQFVTEGVLLAVASSAAGILGAHWLMILLRTSLSKRLLTHLPFLDDVALNSHTILFASAVGVLAAFLLAATPVLRLSFQDVREGLSDGGRTSAGQLWRRLGANLVIVELAVAVVLLTGAGLLSKSLYRLMHVDNGFDTSHLATVWIMAPENIYTNDEQKLALYREIERRVGALPGVQSVGLTTDTPVECNCDTDWIRIPGKPYHGEHNDVLERDVSASYLPTLKARLVRGQLFSSNEDATKPHVIVINQAFARKFFPGEDPVGQKVGDILLSTKSMRTIVGVIADVREGTLDSEIWPAEYGPISQNPNNYPAVAVRTAQDEKAVLPSVVSTLRSIDPNLGVYGERSMTDQIQSTQTALLHRYSSGLVAGFAALALVLGIVGLYGVVAYSVSRRTREIGVRMALGAERRAVYKLVMRQAGWLTAVGVAIGLVCAVGASTLMRKLLFGVQAWDLPTLAAVALVLAVASLLASYLPARRAASVNPVDALRAE